MCLPCLLYSGQIARIVQIGCDSQGVWRDHHPHYCSAAARAGEIQQTHQENGSLPQQSAEGTYMKLRVWVCTALHT